MKEKYSFVKWLTLLFCFHVASAAITVVDGLFTGDDWLQWISKAITAAMIVCLVSLGSENRLYRWSAVFKAVVLGITLINTLLFTPVMKYWQEYTWIFTVLSWISIAASYPATIFEYLAHGKTAPDIRKGWSILLIASLIWSLIGNVFSTFAVRQDTLNWSYELLDGISGGMRLVNIVFHLIYLWFLYRTVKICKETKGA